MPPKVLVSPISPRMQRAAAKPILRAQLRSSAANGHVPASFVPQIRKLVFEFCERWPTSAPLRDVLSGGVQTIASENPHVEVVLKKRMFKEPVVRGFYREFATALPFATLHHDECLNFLLSEWEVEGGVPQGT